MTELFTCEQPRPGLVVIAGDLRVASARALAAELLDALDEQPQLDVDLLNVTAADLSTVQIMLVLTRDATQRGKSVRYVGYGAALERLVKMFQLDGELGGPLAVVWG
jgi:ABC-type transporter Mla MlaB component